MMQKDETRYLGDSVYVTYDGYQLWIYTSNDNKQRYNMIAIDGEVMRSLIIATRDLPGYPQFI